MFNIKSIKKVAKSFLRKNIWTLIVAGILITFVIGETTVTNVSFSNLELSYNMYIRLKDNYNLNLSKEEENQETKNIIKQYSSNIVSQVFSGSPNSFITEYNEKYNITKGIFYDIFSIVSTSRIQLTQLVNRLLNNQDMSIIATSILIIMATISLLIKVLLANPLVIGKDRIFLESIYYHKTKLNVITSAFKKERYSNAVKTVFLKNIYQLLWNITVVGGIIKNYSYKMVTFIQAENGLIEAKQSILLSRKLMDGHKLECFKIDLSFIGWNLLVIITFGLAGIFVVPYYEATMAEYYRRLREEYINNKKEGYELLNDKELFINQTNKPTYSDAKTKEERRKKIQEEYEEINSHYDTFDYILFFFLFAILGWLWEVLYFALQYGVIVNRGALYGPWLPIYGFGCSFIILVFSKLKRLSKLQTNPFKTFIFIMILCTLLEYLTSYFLEKIHGIRYWEYNGIFLNINGRVCLENSIFFGIGGSLCIYFFGPLFQREVHKIPISIKKIFCTIFVCICLIDSTYALFYPHKGEYITNNVQEKSKIENIINERVSTKSTNI